MTSSRPLIGRGVRAPDFALPRLGGSGSEAGPGGDGPVRFYGRVGGRPVLLLFGDDAPATTHPLALQVAATADQAVDVWLLTRTAGLSPDPGAGAPPGTDHASAEAEVVLDAEGRVHQAYGIPSGAPHAVLLDANLRVLATVPVADLGTAVTTLADALPPRPTGEGELAPRIAPVLYVPDAITADMRDRLLALYETGGSVATGVETVVDGARAEATDVRRKRRRDHVVTDPELLRELTQHLGSRVFPELQKAFAFAAGGFEGFKIACYEDTERGHFEAHRDNLSQLTAHRRFGFSLNLNDGYRGGELRFPEYGPTRHRPAEREALLFSGSHLHEVLPVTEGRRFVLLTFVLAKGATIAR